MIASCYKSLLKFKNEKQNDVVIVLTYSNDSIVLLAKMLVLSKTKQYLFFSSDNA